MEWRFSGVLWWVKLPTICEDQCREQLCFCSESRIQSLRSSVQCTCTVGTFVKDLMKSSSSTAPALSFDTTKIEKGVNKCTDTHTHGLTVGSLVIMYVSHISLEAGISEDHTLYNCLLVMKKTWGKCGRQWKDFRGTAWRASDTWYKHVHNVIQLLS